MSVPPVRAPSTTEDDGYSSLTPNADYVLVPISPPAYPTQDEGFHEEGRSQAGDDDVATAQVAELLRLILLQSPEARKKIAKATIYSLPNHEKEELKSVIDELTHFDPANYCPHEIMLQILSYLSPKDLLVSASVSKTWRLKTQDERLWECGFAREGWVLDKSRVHAFEKQWGKKSVRAAQDTARRPIGLGRRESRKRKTEEAFSEGEGASTRPQNLDGTPARQARDQAVPSHGDGSDLGGEEMEGVELTDPADASDEEILGDAPEPAMTADDALMAPVGLPSVDSAFLDDRHSDFAPKLLQNPNSNRPKVSWPYLYKQRRKLEANWEKGSYNMFQIPHPDFPHEGHDECVYTIQHTYRHLVSGSRDRSIRIWNLQTCRRVGQPLVKHDASVLCLQFDERPEHDLIVSGGSDSFVIAWKFSTGEVIKKMTNAHDESVLNLRFDDRYLVTCSKDKTIKVWNRHALACDDPLVPNHVMKNFNDPTDTQASRLIKEYTLLTTFRGHHAAVNAVMIHEDTIVSASGDRTIKSWNIQSGALERTYSGHTKGIACVQFDGRRIVSGSSDNSVRIFDAVQQAEVACLDGHSNLVRTVQARFGDLDITTDEELEHEARKADQEYYRAVIRGMTPAQPHRRTQRQRNAGSSRPEDMLAVGTKVPPGGGGSRWAKIVSGSYDETVILWKRDPEGKWIPKLRLHQDMLLRGRPRRHIRASALPQPPNLNHINGQAQQPLAMQTGHDTSQQNQPTSAAATAAAANPPSPSNQQHHQQAHQSQGAPVQPAQTNAPSNTATASGGGNPAAAAQSHGPNNNSNNHSGPQNPTAAGGAAMAHNAQPHTQPYAPAQQAGPTAMPPQGLNASAGHRESNRVFKLQFDARRIICCSQNKVIVGWDFANGDPELERIGEWSVETL